MTKKNFWNDPEKGSIFLCLWRVSAGCPLVVSLLSALWAPSWAVPARFPSRASQVHRCPHHFLRFETPRQVGGAHLAPCQARAGMAAASTCIRVGRRRGRREAATFLKCPPRPARHRTEPRAPCFQLTLKKLQFLYFIGMRNFQLQAAIFDQGLRAFFFCPRS